MEKEYDYEIMSPWAKLAINLDLSVGDKLWAIRERDRDTDIVSHFGECTFEGFNVVTFDFDTFYKLFVEQLGSSDYVATETDLKESMEFFNTHMKDKKLLEIKLKNSQGAIIYGTQCKKVCGHSEFLESTKGSQLIQVIPLEIHPNILE